MNLNVGILIIGSLLWRRNRESWRIKALCEKDAFSVRAPIRYGRKSRGQTYTMVFSLSAPYGDAIAIPCKSKVCSIDDLLSEAKVLWAAEINEDSTNQVCNDWGSVALLPNPNRVPSKLLQGWADYVRKEPLYGRISTAHNEQMLLNSGVLQIPWHSVINEADARKDRIDLFLATANAPTLSGPQLSYADPEQIARAWIHNLDQSDYFYNNCMNGIHTFQDNAIVQWLSAAEENWSRGM